MSVRSTSIDKSSEDNGRLENAVEINASYRLHTSCCSSLSSDGDLSLSTDCELEAYVARIGDELPAFEIRLVSPFGRTPSPIESTGCDDNESASKSPTRSVTPSPRQDNPEYVALQDINAQISPPSDSDEGLSRTSSLETIFEGVFLNTPTRRHCVVRSCSSSGGSQRRTNLFEKVLLSRLQVGKDSTSPVPRAPPSTSEEPSHNLAL